MVVGGPRGGRQRGLPRPLLRRAGLAGIHSDLTPTLIIIISFILLVGLSAWVGLPLGASFPSSFIGLRPAAHARGGLASRLVPLRDRKYGIRRLEDCGADPRASGHDACSVGEALLPANPNLRLGGSGASEGIPSEGMDGRGAGRERAWAGDQPSGDVPSVSGRFPGRRGPVRAPSGDERRAAPADDGDGDAASGRQPRVYATPLRNGIASYGPTAQVDERRGIIARGFGRMGSLVLAVPSTLFGFRHPDLLLLRGAGGHGLVRLDDRVLPGRHGPRTAGSQPSPGELRRGFRVGSVRGGHSLGCSPLHRALALGVLHGLPLHPDLGVSRNVRGGSSFSNFEPGWIPGRVPFFNSTPLPTYRSGGCGHEVHDRIVSEAAGSAVEVGRFPTEARGAVHGAFKRSSSSGVASRGREWSSSGRGVRLERNQTTAGDFRGGVASGPGASGDYGSGSGCRQAGLFGGPRTSAGVGSTSDPFDESGGLNGRHSLIGDLVWSARCSHQQVEEINRDSPRGFCQVPGGLPSGGSRGLVASLPCRVSYSGGPDFLGRSLLSGRDREGMGQVVHQRAGVGGLLRGSGFDSCNGCNRLSSSRIVSRTSSIRSRSNGWPRRAMPSLRPARRSVRKRIGGSLPGPSRRSGVQKWISSSGGVWIPASFRTTNRCLSTARWRKRYVPRWTATRHS